MQLQRARLYPRMVFTSRFWLVPSRLVGRGGHTDGGPAIKTTRYFEEHVLRKRPYIRREWCERIVAHPIRREVQPDGCIRWWGRVPEFGGRVFRVVTLPDGETVHNAFPDRDFVCQGDGPEEPR